MLRTRVAQMLLFALVMSTATAVVRAGDREFDAVVDHIRREYHGKKQGGFGLALARMAVHFAHPAGVKSIKLAIFEELSGPQNDAGLGQMLRSNLSSDWKPVVRIYSKKEREQTYVFLRPSGDDVELFVVAVDGEDATVVKAKVDPNAAADWIANGNIFDRDDHDD